MNNRSRGNPAIANQVKSILTDTDIYEGFFTEEIQTVLFKLLKTKSYNRMIEILEALIAINKAVVPAMRGQWCGKVERRLECIKESARLGKKLKRKVLSFDEANAEIIGFYRNLWHDFGKMFPQVAASEEVESNNSPEDGSESTADEPIPVPEIVAERASPIYAGLEIEDQLYQPSNGTEGEIFMGHWCRKCAKDDPDRQIYCPILSGSLAGEQQQEWRYNNNAPVCTAFESKVEISHIDPRELEEVRREAYIQKPAATPKTYTPVASLTDYGAAGKPLEIPKTKAAWKSPIMEHQRTKYWIETTDYKDYRYVIPKKKKLIRSQESFKNSVLTGTAARKAIDGAAALSNS